MQEQVLQLELFVTDLWLSHAAADAERMAQRERVAASELALEGVIKGQELGLWAVTDVLDAMEQLARARLDLVDAERRKDDLIGQLNLVSGAMAE
ncbi:MAG: TolC family protein, partial [Pseudomonadota bacterium]